MRGETGSDKKESEKLLEAIGELPEEMVAEAADQQKIRRIYQKNRRSRFLYFGGGLTAAALMGLVVWGMYAGDGMFFGGQPGNLAEQKTVQFSSDSEKMDDVGADESAEMDGDEWDESVENEWSENSAGQEGAAAGLGIYFPAAKTEGTSKTDGAVSDGQGGQETGADENSGTEEQGQAAQKKNVTGDDSGSKQGTDSEKGADKEAKSFSGENGRRNPIVSLNTSSVKQGKAHIVQTEMILGEAGEKMKYHLTASKGISFLTAAVLDQEGERTEKEKILGETGKHQCLSGTQITFSLPAKGGQDADAAEGMPAEIQTSWRELGIKAVGYIRVRIEKGTEEKREGTIFIGKQKDRYYAEISEQT